MRKKKIHCSKITKKINQLFTHFCSSSIFVIFLKRVSSDPSVSQQQLLYKRFGMEQLGPNEFNKYISKQYYLHAWVDINILIYFLNIKFSCRYRVITDVCKSYHHRNDLPKSPKCYVQLAFPTQKDVHKTINWVKRMWILHESMQSYFFG